MLADSRADELVREWCRWRVRDQCPKHSSYLHYRDCPDIEVYEVNGGDHPLSEVTADLVVTLWAQWGCPHGPEKMCAVIHYQGSLPDLIVELADLENASTAVKQDAALGAIDKDNLEWFPLFAANYPAPGGFVWQSSS